MDGWNTSFLLGWPIFRGELLVSGTKWCIGMPWYAILHRPSGSVPTSAGQIAGPAASPSPPPAPVEGGFSTYVFRERCCRPIMSMETFLGRKPSIAHRSDQSFWRHCSEQWGRDKGECHQASGGRSSNANLQWAEWGVQRQPHWSTAWGITPSELQQKSWSCWLRIQKQKWRRGVDVRGYQTASDQTSCRGRPRHNSRWG